MVVKPVHFWNALLSIEVIELGIVSVPVKLLQPSKADLLIEVSTLGMVKEPVKPLQL